jgi:hypothetical protein
MENKEPSKKEVFKKDSGALFKALEIAWTMGYVIVIPLLGAVWGGMWLDQKTGKSPLFLLSSMFLASVISSVGLVRKFKQYLEKIK